MTEEIVTQITSYCGDVYEKVVYPSNRESFRRIAMADGRKVGWLERQLETASTQTKEALKAEITVLRSQLKEAQAQLAEAKAGRDVGYGPVCDCDSTGDRHFKDCSLRKSKPVQGVNGGITGPTSAEQIAEADAAGYRRGMERGMEITEDFTSRQGKEILIMSDIGDAIRDELARGDEVQPANRAELKDYSTWNGGSY